MEDVGSEESCIGVLCNLLRPLIKKRFLLVPYGYIILLIKRIPKEMTVLLGSTC